MNILLIGGGGREHAIAWKLSQSARLDKLFIAPGNPGTAALGENVFLDISDHLTLAGFCRKQSIDLVVVGPETPLADGICDSLRAKNIRCFGPGKAAAQIEASKVFSKNFMARHGIPTAQYATFRKHAEALAYMERIDFPVVIKASGLAAGKGVILPDSLDEARAALESIFVEKQFGDAGDEVVIEERLSGPEVSLMAFSDGKTVVPMLPAQDHKRLLDNDQGPNTGGMGAYAPAPVLDARLLEEALEIVLKPVISGMRLEGTPFTGVIYAGLMLTKAGMRVLEFNSRFGDPETQVVLPLLETDLLEIMDACENGTLRSVEVKWKTAAAVSVVLASKGYPASVEKGKVIKISGFPEGAICFHAGTRLDADGRLTTTGGRVFAVTAVDENLEKAQKAAYAATACIQFEGAQFRRDIAARALGSVKIGREDAKAAYESSGVSIDAGNRAVELMKEAVRASYTPAVLAGIGSFGGLYDASALKEMKAPVLVASTDGVGTKVKLAAQAGTYRSLGHDIVNHCINDILVQGARPLFFMDYFATSKLIPEDAAEVVTGIAEACQISGLALLGGETAEMPGVYAVGEFDVAGTIVGVLEREKILPRTGDLEPGDVLVGLASSGPHTNGYSLIRKVFEDTPIDTVFDEIGISLGAALLAPHRSYLALLAACLAGGSIKALAHITGGGFIENIPRVLPMNLAAEIHAGSWPVPPLWSIIQRKGKIEHAEMFRVFNMGIGMVVITGKNSVDELRQAIPEPTWVIGELKAGRREVIFR